MNTGVCPLLKDPGSYTPDIQDLSIDEGAREYWLYALEGTVAKFVDKAAELNPNHPRATENAQSCLQQFQRLVERIKSDPRTLTPLSVRTLLDYNEANLRVHFEDAWRTQKEAETERALTRFGARIATLDAILDFADKWRQLIEGALAGNVFDWGSAAVSRMLETTPTYGLTDAMETIERRPWFVDDLDAWIDRLSAGAFKRAVVFVDNAGVDFVLGMLPFVRELLRMGTDVILTANTSPALNDVTHAELSGYCASAAQHCAILRAAMADGRLTAAANGQRGPCLDLKSLPTELCDLMTDSDLVVLEGMGRCVHTNFDAEFAVDSVKMAVLKNDWLAKSLGANQYSVIFKYEPATL